MTMFSLVNWMKLTKFQIKDLLNFVISFSLSKSDHIKSGFYCIQTESILIEMLLINEMSLYMFTAFKNAKLPRVDFEQL
jgi:hypothetical protein